MIRAAVLVFFAGFAPAARATYSIGAVDTNTREVGGAGTSCVGNFSVSEIYGPAESHGLVLAQALFNRDAREYAISRLTADAAPADILAELIDPGFDMDWRRRQYAILDLSGRSARYTGIEASAYAGDQGGELGAIRYAVQGNIVSGVAVLDRASAAFEADACDLADRLMRALEAGAEMGEGDTRCTVDGIPSDGAFIEVDRAGEPRGSYLRLRVDNTRPFNPIVMLRADFDVWRATHPCPPPEVDAGVPDLGQAINRDATINADATTNADAAAPPIARREDSCSCSADRSPSAVSVTFLLTLLAVRRNRIRNKR